MGSARASRAVFRALAESIERTRNSGRFESSHAQEGGREARPATPEAGVLPNLGIRFNAKAQRRTAANKGHSRKL
jgi:hypothetical protein